MVSEMAAWVLTNTRIDPLKVAHAFGIEEQECWEYLEELSRVLHEADQERQDTEIQRRTDLQEFVDTLDIKEIRRQVVLGKLYEAKRNPTGVSVQRLLQEAKAITSPDKERVNEYDILKAKEKSIRELLNVTRPGNISCPFHQDRTPSFQITKKNTFSCYSCGEHGDVIDLYQKIHNCDFKTAVKLLQ